MEALPTSSSNEQLCECIATLENSAVCSEGATCREFGCVKIHPCGRPLKCPLNLYCTEVGCSLLHSPERPRECSCGGKCYDPLCQDLHDPATFWPCSKGYKCHEVKCLKRHERDMKSNVPPFRVYALWQRMKNRTQQKLPVFPFRERFLALKSGDSYCGNWQWVLVFLFWIFFRTFLFLEIGEWQILL